MNGHKEIRHPAAVERLRASKEAAERGDEHAGQAAGRRWAELYAEYGWLERLDELDGTDDPFTVLRKAVDPKDEMSTPDLREACFRDVADCELSFRYISSFVDGALQFFGEVRDDID